MRISLIGNSNFLLLSVNKHIREVGLPAVQLITDYTCSLLYIPHYTLDNTTTQSVQRLQCDVGTIRTKALHLLRSKRLKKASVKAPSHSILE